MHACIYTRMYTQWHPVHGPIPHGCVKAGKLQQKHQPLLCRDLLPRTLERPSPPRLGVSQKAPCVQTQSTSKRLGMPSMLRGLPRPTCSSPEAPRQTRDRQAPSHPKQSLSFATVLCASPATERSPRDCCRFRSAGDLCDETALSRLEERSSGPFHDRIPQLSQLSRTLQDNR